MTLSQIQNVVYVAKELSFSAAAEKNFVSRQAIARSIHELEKELHVELFRTDHANHLSLTEIGEELLPDLEAVLAQTEQIRLKAEAFTQKLEPVRITFSDSIAVFVFQDIIGMLYNTREQNPQLISDIVQQNNLELASGILNDSDIILMLGKPFEIDGYTTEVIKSFPAVLSIPYSSPLYEKQVLSADDLKGQTVIVPIEGNKSLQEFAEKHQITLLPMSNFYACSYASIQNQYLILDVPFPSSDQTLIQKSIADFSFTWELLMLRKKESANANISYLCNQIQKLAKKEKASWIYHGPSF